MNAYIKHSAGRILPTSKPVAFFKIENIRFRIIGCFSSAKPRRTKSAAMAHSEPRVAPSSIFNAIPNPCSGKIAVYTPSAPVFNTIPPSSLVEWILKDEVPVRMQLQMHKNIWPSQAKGV